MLLFAKVGRKLRRRSVFAPLGLMLAITLLILAGSVLRHWHQTWFKEQQSAAARRPREVVSVFSVPGGSASSVSASPAGYLSVGFIGDSLSTNGTPSAAESTGLSLLEMPGMRQVTIVNHAQAGTSAGDWLPENPDNYFASAVAGFRQHRVRVVCVMLGTNDCSHFVQTPPPRYQVEMQTLVSRLCADGFVVVLNLPPDPHPGSGKWQVEAPGLMQQYRIRLVSIQQAHLQQVALGDTSLLSVFKTPNATLDGVHPKPQTIRIMGEDWAKTLRRAFCLNAARLHNAAELRPSVQAPTTCAG